MKSYFEQSISGSDFAWLRAKRRFQQSVRGQPGTTDFSNSIDPIATYRDGGRGISGERVDALRFREQVAPTEVLCSD
jgi:hypothetical protein